MESGPNGPWMFIIFLMVIWAGGLLAIWGVHKKIDSMMQDSDND